MEVVNISNQAQMDQLARQALEAVQRRGAGPAEVYISNNKELTVEVRHGRVETLKLAEERGLGMRVLVGDRLGFAFTTDLTPGGMEDVAGRAYQNAVAAAPDSHRTIPEPADTYPAVDVFDPAIRKATVEEKTALAMRMEQAARDYDPRVKLIESAVYQDGEAEVFIYNTRGMQLCYRSAACVLYLALVAGQGDDQQTGFAIDYVLRYADLNPEKVGREAARKAVAMLGSRPVSTMTGPVVLDPYVATSFLGLLAPSLSAEAVQKNRSLLAGRMGQAVAAPGVRVIDDGALPGGIATAPFDGEGVPTRRTVLVDGGVLQSYLHNAYTAARAGERSTGNGVRHTYKATPEVGPTNLFIDPGDTAPEALIKDISRGLYITEVLGMHTANPISGDFSVGAAGLLIENGQLTRAVRGVTLAGNIIEVLQRISGIGNDLTFYGGKGSPTLLVSSLTVGGH
ncbi:MAG: TldD/PmbA family protein [Desulfurispora sp.]|uniref:TldD/PmbA family protein n=1 Tax=Desulfurispora sp. TaxID=3014275 RepID=UPI004049FCD0